MVRASIIACMLPLLCACDSSLSECEDAIMAGLVAPSTYQRIDYDYCDINSCSIEYDAMNAMGTPLRKSALCIRSDRTKPYMVSDTTDQTRKIR